MDSILDSLCLFTTHGETYTFRNVQIIHDNEKAISFTYSAMSDAKKKEATFYKPQIVGISKCHPERATA